VVVAGDNLFTDDVSGLAAYAKDVNAPVIAIHDVGDLELARKYGIVSLDGDDRVLAFEEKPEDPRTTLAATATYIYHRAHVPLVRRYLDEGNSPDQPGRFVAWLHTHVPVYGYTFEGDWRDVGDAQQLLEADNRLREAAGLPPRTSYALE
jgi:glucose-1-phosphate thymidylyltransferase